MRIGTLADMRQGGHAAGSVVRRALATALALGLLAACSGERPPTRATAASPPGPEPGAVDAVTPAAGDVPADPAAAATDTAAAPSAGATARRPSAPAPRSAAPAASTTGEVATGGEDPSAGGAAMNATVPRVPPFRPGDERTGITDDVLKICMHANGQAADAVGAGKEDAKVFWNWLNDRGGIHGRKVELIVTDDGDGTKVASAYEGCRGSFLLVGGPTQDAIPAMREIVENDPAPMPYLHFMARRDPTKAYSFSWYPTQEEYGRRAAEFVLATHPGRKIGIIRRDTPNWTPGYEAFVARLAEAGVQPVTALGHPAQERIYDAYLAELDAKGAEVVWAWNHALEHVPMLKQAKTRGFEFQWVLGFPVSAVSETLREDLLQPTVTGVAVFAPFSPGLYDRYQSRYEEQGKLYEAAYQKYRGQPVNAVLGDLLFFQWLESRQVASLLERCGRDCTRTKLVTTLLTSMTAVEPKCPFDFTLGRAAGSAVLAVEAYAPRPGAVAWRETAHCVTSF